MRVFKGYLKPWIFGVIAGALIVFGEIIFKIYPPSAFAFCLTCHARDLVNTIVNSVFGTHFEVTKIAEKALLITPVGVLAGSFLSAFFSAEVKLKKPEQPIVNFIIGFIVMIIGIIIFGCPTRIIVRAGYGEFYGIIALLALFLGIFCGTILMKIINKLRV
jgi:hypothetical protein